MDCECWVWLFDPPLPLHLTPIAMIYKWFSFADSILNIKSLHSSTCKDAPTPFPFVLTSHRENWKIVKQTSRSKLCRENVRGEGWKDWRRRKWIINQFSRFFRHHEPFLTSRGVLSSVAWRNHLSFCFWHGHQSIQPTINLNFPVSKDELFRSVFFRMTKVISPTSQTLVIWAQSWSSFDMLSP